jgi:hypothetical protein
MKIKIGSVTRKRIAALLLALAALTVACSAALAATYPVVDVTFFVTKGAGLGVFSKQGGEGLGAVHFKSFPERKLTPRGESGAYDVYTVSLPSATAFHY